MSQDPQVAALIVAQEAACRDACGVAVACSNEFSDVDQCAGYFWCSEMAGRLDQEIYRLYDLHGEVDEEIIEDYRQEFLSCLSAGAVHMTCVAGLDCLSYLAWWDEAPDPFPCSTEQSAEEDACGGTGLYGY